MTPPGSLDLDPGSQEKPVNSWCVSFETECKCLYPKYVSIVLEMRPGPYFQTSNGPMDRRTDRRYQFYDSHYIFIGKKFLLTYQQRKFLLIKSHDVAVYMFLLMRNGLPNVLMS